MHRTSFEDMRCSIAQCLEAVGEWWSLLIVRDVFRGITRFADLESDLGISRNVLNQRLARLVEQGILERVRYQDHPPRFDYELTGKGRDLFPVLTAMRQWGDRWAAPDGPPVQIVHDSCGQVSEGVLTCSACGEELTAAGIHRIPGPGAPSPAGNTEPGPRRPSARPLAANTDATSPRIDRVSAGSRYTDPGGSWGIQPGAV